MRRAIPDRRGRDAERAAFVPCIPTTRPRDTRRRCCSAPGRCSRRLDSASPRRYGPPMTEHPVFARADAEAAWRPSPGDLADSRGADFVAATGLRDLDAVQARAV